MQESLEPVYVNDEAVAILAYPEKPGNISSAQNIVAMKVRSILGDKQSEIQSGLATRFVSGKRRYLCRAFPIGSGSHNSDRHASFALVLERYVAVPIDISELAEQYHLTTRERETTRCLLEGLTSKEIAVRMNISPNTVKAFLRLVMVKMGATTRSGIIGRIFIDQQRSQSR